MGPCLWSYLNVCALKMIWILIEEKLRDDGKQLTHLVGLLIAPHGYLGSQKALCRLDRTAARERQEHLVVDSVDVYKRKLVYRVLYIWI